MRAAVFEAYGPPETVRLAEVPLPEPRRDEVRIRVVSAAVTVADSRIRGARFPRGFGAPARLAFGLRRPRVRVLGSAFSGVVDAVGPNAASIAIGDEVCGMSGARMGAHAEYVLARRRQLVHKPAAVSHDEAAGVLFGGSTAEHYLTAKATVRSGDAVLVIGASGAVGTNAVQLAKHLGATVTAVTSAANADLVSRLGADEVIDYTTTGLDSIDRRFDVVLDAVGSVSAAAGARLTSDRGVLLLVVADLWDTIRPRRRVRSGPAPETAAVFERLLRLVGEKRLEVVIDAVHPLSDIAVAHRRVDSGRKVGNILVRP